jgi:deoxyribodipyrimidine photo-lyase
VYFQQALRTHDHAGLIHACESDEPVLGLFVLDPHHIATNTNGFSRIGQHRLSWLANQLIALDQSLSELGIALMASIDSLQSVLSRLRDTYDILSIDYESLPGSEEQTDIALFKTYFPNANLRRHAMHSLIHPDDLPFAIDDLPPSYTEARITIEKNIIVRPCLPEPKTRSNRIHVSETVNMFKPYATQSSFILVGEKQAQAVLHQYLFIDQHALTYKQTRNQLEPWSSSSKWSIYLSLGILSPRYIYWQLKKLEATIAKNQSTYWLWFELLWRDYFHFLHLKYGNLFFKQDGLKQRHIEWTDQPTFKQAILDAKTGYPLVDANLIELYQTGWMSNRGRQNVANFISKILRLDWRWGASLFEHYLIDYDVSSNYGNWQYLSGVGVDPREDRIFNVSLQAKKYDPQGNYLRRWLPALKSIPTPTIFQPWKMNGLEMSMYQCVLGQDYPLPIMDDRRVQLQD